MGCDIHMVLEKKYGNKWVGISLLPNADGRCYELFGALANVRGRGRDPIGLPDDISELARLEHGGCPDWHSESHMLLGDILEIYSKVYEEPIDAIAKSMFDMWCVFDKDLITQRVVFWFDN